MHLLLPTQATENGRYQQHNYQTPTRDFKIPPKDYVVSEHLVQPTEAFKQAQMQKIPSASESKEGEQVLCFSQKFNPVLLGE